MNVKISRAPIQLINLDAVIKAVMLEDLNNGDIIIGKDFHTNTNTISIAICKWLDVEHDEEETFRRVCRKVLNYVYKSTWNNIAFDIDSVSNFMGERSYISNIIIEELDAFKEFALTVWLISADSIDYRKSSVELDNYLRVLNDEDTNYSFCDEDDPIRDEFEEYRGELKTEKTFREYLVELIDGKGYRKFSEVYKPSGVSKATFSKIVNWNINPPHKPSKETIAALAIGLELSITEAEEFYNKAGYHLTKTEIVDVVVRFFIERDDKKPIYKHQKIDEVNYCLEHLGLPPLGEKPRETCKIDIKK